MARTHTARFAAASGTMAGALLYLTRVTGTVTATVTTTSLCVWFGGFGEVAQNQARHLLERLGLPDRQVLRELVGQHVAVRAHPDTVGRAFPVRGTAPGARGRRKAHSGQEAAMNSVQQMYRWYALFRYGGAFDWRGRGTELGNAKYFTLSERTLHQRGVRFVRRTEGA